MNDRSNENSIEFGSESPRSNKDYWSEYDPGFALQLKLSYFEEARYKVYNYEL